jgi:SHS2 domain-containing protein
MPYEFLEHTGDAKMRASGETPEELFTEALRGMMEYLEPMVFKNNDAEADQVIKLTAPDRAALLTDFLGRALRLAQEHNELYERVNFIKLTETELTAELYGRLVQQFDRDIKTVSCSDAEGREADVVFK